MARIPSIRTAEGLNPEQRRVFGDIAKSRGIVRGPFSVLLHSPLLAERTAHLGSFVRFEASVPIKARAIAVLTTGRHFDCQFEWSANVDDAQAAGVDDGTIASIRDKHAPLGLQPDDRLVFELVTQLLTRHRIDEPTFTAALERFGTIGLVELVGSVGYYSNLAMSLNAFEVETTPDFPPLLPID
jgi:4-carboxymuconolactone decarboxylase